MTDQVAAWARRLAAGEALDPAMATAEAAQRDALGWALKAACHDAWNTDPTQVPLIARALNGLLEAAPTATLHALAAWTQGLADIIEGRMEPALAAFDTARDRLRALGKPAEGAQTQVPKLIALAILGRTDAALECAEAALGDFLAANDARSAGKVELNLASMLLRQERYPEAAERYRQAAVRFARLADTEHSVMADIGLATTLSWQFQFDDARLMLERARMRADAHGLPVLAALARGSLGQLELHQGRHLRALHELEASARALVDAGAPQRHAEAERALADAYLALNLWPEAESLLRSVLATAQAVEAPVEEARAVVDLALAQVCQGDTDGAARSLGRAHALFEAQSNPVGQALARLRRGALQLAQGDAAAALADGDAAAQAFAGAGVRGWQHQAQALAAQALLAQGRADEALERLEAGRGAAVAQSLDGHVAAYDALLGATHETLSDLARARACYERAVLQFDAQRRALRGDEWRARFGADKQAPYDAMIRLAAARSQVGEPGAAADLLRWIEHGRSPALGLALPAAAHDAWAAGASAPTPDDGPTARGRARWHWLHHQWQQALADGTDLARAAALEQQTHEAERDLLEAARRARLTAAPAAPAADGRLGPSAGLDVASLMAALPADAAMIVYHVDATRWRACVVDARGVRTAEGPAEGLAREVEQARFQIDAMRYGAAPLHAHLDLLAARCRLRLQALHARLMAPLEPLLSEARRLVIIAHGALHAVPFAALHDGQRWLVDRYDIAMAPSVAVWLAGRHRPARALHRALVASHGNDLPHGAAEARAVAGLWGHGATWLDGNAATGAAVRTAAGGADVLHLACHGHFRADNPAFSTLRLADGPWTMLDIADTRIDAELVTLSACETGSGLVIPGDEVIGLVRGFLLAGAASVVATLWTIDDAATATLMTDFYSRVRGGDSVTAALSGAQRAAAARWPHPYHWAAFTLHGRG